MFDILQKEKCCGCGACSVSCPKMCISMVPDEEGFLYPIKNETQCVDCGICEKVCPQKSINETDYQASALGVINKDECVRENSSSGGVFSTIAEHVIERGGAVFGASFNDNMEVVHECIDSLDNLHRLRGSKYVQSKIGDAYEKAKELLKCGRLVLFAGTPCQIAGLKSMLGREYDNLICQDVACHGSPSPLVWKKYVEYREKKAKSVLSRASFRCKDTGWQSYSVLFEFKNGKRYIRRASKDLYMCAFTGDLSLRPSCHNCIFKGGNYLSDITLADFWGVQNVAPDMYDDKGTSLVVIRSEKGNSVFESIKNKFTYLPVDFEKALKYNGAMVTSAKRSENREKFFAGVNCKSFDIAVKENCNKTTLAKRIIRRINKILK